MDLTIEECNFLLNAVNAQAKIGFQDGLIGSQKAMVVAMKLQTYAATLQGAVNGAEPPAAVAPPATVDTTAKVDTPATVDQTETIDTPVADEG